MCSFGGWAGKGLILVCYTNPGPRRLLFASRFADHPRDVAGLKQNSEIDRLFLFCDVHVEPSHPGQPQN